MAPLHILQRIGRSLHQGMENSSVFVTITIAKLEMSETTETYCHVFVVLKMEKASFGASFVGLIFAQCSI
jgi:hypothetical protein